MLCGAVRNSAVASVRLLARGRIRRPSSYLSQSWTDRPCAARTDRVARAFRVLPYAEHTATGDIPLAPERAARSRGNSTIGPRVGHAHCAVPAILTAGICFRCVRRTNGLTAAAARPVGGTLSPSIRRRAAAAAGWPLFERAQARLLARDVVARDRHDALALGELDLEHHHVLVAERHLGGRQIELPHPQKRSS